jgi:Domain of unknown function (DUF1707)
MDRAAKAYPPGDLRASDTERDEALSELSEAYQTGRITVDEFDERSGQVLRARTGRELTALLADLPGHKGAVADGSTDAGLVSPPGRWPAARIITGATIFAVVIGGFAILRLVEHRMGVATAHHSGLLTAGLPVILIVVVFMLLRAAHDRR